MINNITIGPVTLHMYGIMIAIGFLAALWLCLVWGRKKRLNESNIWGIFYCALGGGLLGARLLFLIVELPSVLRNPSMLLQFSNGFVVYGGILGGVLACFVFCRAKAISFLDYFDLCMPSVSLAQCFGRLGCFFAGCCYGHETDSPLGIVFTNSDYAPNGIKLIPTQLISAGGNLLFFIILLCYSARTPLKGRTGAAWLVLYSIGRFTVEYLRDDYRGNVGNLSTSQLISIMILAIGLILWIAVDAKKSSTKAL